MKFALLTTNLTGGGAEKALANIARGLAARGHDVSFIVCDDTGVYRPPPDCRLHVLGVGVGHGWLAKRRLAWRLQRLLRGANHDLLVSTLPFADEVAVLARLPRHVCRIANTLSAEIARLPTAKAARRAARYRGLYGRQPLVAVSQGVADDLQACFGVAEHRLRVIANPFDVAALRALATMPCAALPAGPFILHVGRYAAQKRHDLLLEAFAKLEPPHILVLMTPPDAGLVAQISAKGLERRVAIADFQANPYPWMAAADLLVLCSDHEGLPNVLIEALACGTRVVSTDCLSGPREILTGSLAQWLVPCGDAEALARAMAAALKAPKPEGAVAEAALAPYAAERALDAWEALAREAF